MFKRVLIVLAGLSIASFALAQAPIDDLSQAQGGGENASAPPGSDQDATQGNFQDNSQDSAQAQPHVVGPPLSPEERITRVEQQVANLAQMNLPGRVDALQQQVQQLQGQMEMQSHQLELLQNQIKELPPASSSSGATQSKNDTDSSGSTTIAKQGDEAAYQTAFSLVDNKKYNQAVAALQEYLKSYPQGKYVVNAHYWLGEIYFMQSKNDLAAKEFKVITDQFPNNSKMPDALLKIAFIEDAKGSHTQAKQQLEKIIKRFPGTSAAQLASIRLKSMQ
jgi:tol-pal system protein YbgF